MSFQMDWRHEIQKNEDGESERMDYVYSFVFCRRYKMSQNEDGEDVDSFETF